MTLECIQEQFLKNVSASGIVGYYIYRKTPDDEGANAGMGGNWNLSSDGNPEEQNEPQQPKIEDQLTKEESPHDENQ